ncbi:MAG: peptidoglycan D,D-transpeptidase FtsI family protein [Lachnospiraceae bacterium]
MKTSQNNHRSKRLFTQYMQEKLAITVMVITLALFALIYVLYDIVKNNEQEYNQIILSQQSYDSRVIPYRRGDVVDRNGTLLATSEKVYNLIIDPKQIMQDEEDYLEPTVTALVDVFGYDRAELTELIRTKDTYYVRYERRLNYDQKEAFETYAEEANAAFRKAKSSQRIKGVWFEDEYKRVYPYGSMGCNVIGFVNADGSAGIDGIEKYYNSTLTGNNGREYGYLNDESNLERVIKSPTNGNTVVSTIDVNIQNIVEKYIRQWEEQTGSERVGVIVMDPDNGEILAMASDKEFDLNDPWEISAYYPDESAFIPLGEQEAVDDYKRKHDGETITLEQVYEHYTSEEVKSLGKQVAWNQVWRNFCVSDTYEPGSPSKIFTIAAALEEGVINGSEYFECDGYQQVSDYKIGCVNTYGHGPLSVAESLMVSCNDVIMQIVSKVGKERFYKYQSMFGFDTKTGIDLPGEADTKALGYTAETADPTSLATNAFGQNYNCTMVQMAAAYCSVINGGSYYQPHVVKQILNEQGSVVEKHDPVLVRETVSQSTSNFINDALFQTVHGEKGTGKKAQVAGYLVGGKTGTAEKIPRDHTNYLVSFAGFAPADDPEVFVYVVIDEPHVEKQSTGGYPAIMFSEILTEILPYLNVFPTVEVPAGEGEQETLPQEVGINDNTVTTEPSEGASEESQPQEENQPENQPESQAPETDANGETLDSESDGGEELPAMVPSQETEVLSTEGVVTVPPLSASP